MFLAIQGLILYCYVNELCVQNIKKEYISNTISSIHNILSIIITYMWLQYRKDYILYFMFLNTGGYYLYDSFAILIKLRKKYNIMQSIYIYHHFVFLFVLNYHPNDVNWMELFYWSELANFQTKCVYYLLKKQKINNEKYTITEIAKIIQFIFYVYVRIYKLTYLTYIELNTAEILFPIQLCMPLLPIGYIWTLFIFKSINFNILCKCNKYKFL